MHHLRFQIRRTAADRHHPPRHVPSQSPRCGLYVRPQRQVTIHKGFMSISFLSAVRRAVPAGQRGLPLPNQHTGGCKCRHDASVPLSNQPRMMRALDLTCRCGIAQWGHQLTADRTTSATATQPFSLPTTSQNHPPKDRPQDEAWRSSGSWRSQLAIMDGDGFVATVGHFIDDHGLLFSNDSYRPVGGTGPPAFKSKLPPAGGFLIAANSAHVGACRAFKSRAGKDSALAVRAARGANVGATGAKKKRRANCQTLSNPVVLFVYDALGDLYPAVCAGLEHDDRRAVRRSVLDVKGLCP